MRDLQTHITNYLQYCETQKRLDKKTLKAYQIDLKQFTSQLPVTDIQAITSEILENFISPLHRQYKPKTVKRKIASTKALFHYLEYRDLVDRNPFNKLEIRFREPVKLPKTIPLHTVEHLLNTVYSQRTNANTLYKRRNALRDVAVIELLFATGMRISELCSLKPGDVNLEDRTIRISGKGSKERCMQIGNDVVAHIVEEYKNDFQSEIENCKHFLLISLEMN